MSRMMYRVVGLLAVVLGLTAGMIAYALPASAVQTCWSQAVSSGDGSIHYEKACKEVKPGDQGGGGGTNEPTCDLAAAAGWAQSGLFCDGKAVCWVSAPFSGVDPPATPAPDGQEYGFTQCVPCGACLGPPSWTWRLYGTQARPLIVQAQEAFGNLQVPVATVHHSPTGDAVVNLGTWFWIDQATFRATQGSSAEGLVAVAEPDTTTWDPGDGSGIVTCDGPGTPWSSGSSGTGCTHTYSESSPGYSGAVTRHWTVYYENGGARVTIPGAPLELTSVTPFTLAVVEVQVVVGR